MNRRLTLEGFVVISLGVFSLSDPSDHRLADDPELLERLGRLHFQKIRMADEVFIVDPGGYVGEATRREIAYAESLGKPVRYLSRESSFATRIARDRRRAGERAGPPVTVRRWSCDVSRFRSGHVRQGAR